MIFQNKKLLQDAGVFRNSALRLQPNDGMGDLSAYVLHLRGLSLHLNKNLGCVMWQLYDENTVYLKNRTH